MLESYVTFFKAHEKILIVVLGVALTWGLAGKIETVIEKHDVATLSVAQAASAAAAAKVQSDETLIEQQKEANDALTAKLTTANAVLAQADAALTAALAKQQKADAAMTPPETVQRWNTLVPAAGVTLTPNGITLPSVGATATVQELEEVPVLRGELSNSSAEKKNVDALLLSSTQQVSTLNIAVGDLKVQVAKDDAACKEEIKVQHDKDITAAHKRETWIAVVGTILGYALHR